MSAAVLLNGVPCGEALALHRGLHYGDGVFRTCLIYSRNVIDLEEHIEKLSADAGRLGLDAPSRAALAAEARSLAQDQERAVLKLMLLRAGGERGYRAGGREADRLACRYAAPQFPAAHWELGIRAARSAFRLAAQPALAGIKHLNRLEQVLASRSWPAGADEQIVEDDAGRPVSGTRTNLFWVSGTRLRTPALDRCGVAGLLRDKVLAAARTLGQGVEVAAGSWAELDDAREAFVTNSVIGIWPVASLGGRTWPAPGPLTGALMQKLAHPRLAA